MAASWIGFFVYVLFCLAPQWGQTEFAGASIASTTTETAGIWIVGPDYGSYFQAALSWYRDGILVDQSWHWVTNIWPPGMVLTEFGVMKVVGWDGNFIVVMVVLTSMIWATVLTAGMRLCPTSRGKAIYLAGFAVLFTTTPFSENIAGESFALPTGFAIASTLLALSASHRLGRDPTFIGPWPTRREAFWLGFVIGPLLAVALLYRVSNLWLVYILLLVGVGVAVVLITEMVSARRISKQGPGWNVSVPGLRLLLVRLILITVAPLLTTFVWTTIVSDAAHPGRFSYTVVMPELAYGAVWKSDEQIIASGNEWLLATSSNWACRIDPPTCREIETVELGSPRPYAGIEAYTNRDYLTRAVGAAVRDPVAYIRERAPKAWRFWSANNTAQGLLFLLASVLAVLVSARAVRQHRDVQAIVFLTFVATATLPMLWILFYYYYFFPLQVGSVFYLLVNQDRVTEYWRSGLRRETVSTPIITNDPTELVPASLSQPQNRQVCNDDPRS